MRNLVRLVLMSFVLVTAITSCSKDLAEDEIFIKTEATEGDTGSDDDKPDN
ncbi:hypothetical protein [Maribacter sp. R77961]|uniref:hypothetical protein n=1 Tax=Maribacter sp. R77961 TaxID=3093871 RepID=UPI0037CB6D42